MDLSLGLPVSGAWATPENITSVARDADVHGFRGVWTFQRWLADDRLPSVYRSVLDPIVALAFAAGATSRVRLGLGLINGPFYPPVAVAKQFASLDVLSAGRFDAGVGLGWADYEYVAAGVPMHRRGRRFDEWLDCLDVLLTSDPAEFAGEFYQVPRAHISPMPVQRPRPPLLLGGSAPAALRRAGARGDGWISSSRAGLDEVRAGVRAVRAAAEQAGRSGDRMRCVVRGVTVLRDTAVDGDRAVLTGSLDQLRDDLAAYAAAGVDEVFLDLNFDYERVGNPDADPTVGMELAERLLPLGRERF